VICEGLATVSYNESIVASSALYCSFVSRGGIRERGALGHPSVWGPTQVWPIQPFVWKVWKYPLLMCSLLPHRSIFCGADFDSAIAFGQWFLSWIRWSRLRGSTARQVLLTKPTRKRFFIKGINGVVPDRTIWC